MTNRSIFQLLQRRACGLPNDERAVDLPVQLALELTSVAPPRAIAAAMTTNFPQSDEPIARVSECVL
jgi:hypothetical protein